MQCRKVPASHATPVAARPRPLGNIWRGFSRGAATPSSVFITVEPSLVARLCRPRLNCLFAYLGLGCSGAPCRAHARDQRNRQAPYKRWQGRVARHARPNREPHRRHARIPAPSLGTFPDSTFRTPVSAKERAKLWTPAATLFSLAMVVAEVREAALLFRLRAHITPNLCRVPDIAGYRDGATGLGAWSLAIASRGPRPFLCRFLPKGRAPRRDPRPSCPSSPTAAGIFVACGS
jgi:hypothetical protein